MAFGAAALLVAIAPLPHSAAAPAERLFRVEAGDFAYTPAVLQVNPGDKVTVELVSTDVGRHFYRRPDLGAGQLSLYFPIRGGSINEQ